MQLLLVKTWKVYQLIGASILKRKTEEEMEVIKAPNFEE